MQGAGNYAIPMYSTYEQMGLEKFHDKLAGYIYYGNHTVFDFGEHARGRTLDIYIIKDEDDLRKNGLYDCDRLKVYGMISGQCGWDEKYGWIIEGNWCEYINGILKKSIELHNQNQLNYEREKQQKKIEERKTLEARAKEFSKFF